MKTSINGAAGSLARLSTFASPERSMVRLRKSIDSATAISEADSGQYERKADQEIRGQPGGGTVLVTRQWK